MEPEIYRVTNFYGIICRRCTIFWPLFDFEEGLTRPCYQCGHSNFGRRAYVPKLVGTGNISMLRHPIHLFKLPTPRGAGRGD